MIPAILTDFDDTAAVQNVAEMLLHRFGDGVWQEVRARFRAGELSLKDYQEITFRSINADRETMQVYVKENANLRPHFGELWKFCQDLNSPMAVVSLGLDFYIRALLEKEGAPDVPLYCVNTRFTPQGISYYYHHAYPGRRAGAIPRAWWLTATGSWGITLSTWGMAAPILRRQKEPTPFLPTVSWLRSAGGKASPSGPLPILAMCWRQPRNCLGLPEPELLPRRNRID